MVNVMRIVITTLLASGCALPLNGTGTGSDLPLATDAGESKSETSTTDETSTPPPNGDQVTVAVCHSATLPQLGPTRAECPHGYQSGVSGIAYLSNCELLVVPVECSTCDYTCDCLLRYVALPDAGCACSQNTTGGTLVLNCPLR
jgi:hypothetical protein